MVVPEPVRSAIGNRRSRSQIAGAPGGGGGGGVGGAFYGNPELKCIRFNTCTLESQQRKGFNPHVSNYGFNMMI